jgi:hypothetical protein
MPGQNSDNTDRPTPPPDRITPAERRPSRPTRPSRRRGVTGPRTRAPAQVWSIDQIRALGAVTDLRTAARILGLSANTAYALAQRGAFPVTVIRAGGQYRVSVPAILAVLDAPPDSPQPTPADGEDAGT